MKKLFVILTVIGLLFTTACTAKPQEEPVAAGPKPDVTIVYTSDIHGYLNNQVTDENDKSIVTDQLNYAKVKALKDDLIAKGETVFLVDAGDNIQGNALGSYDEGKSCVDLMAECGYDMTTIGNHEFDYGMFRALDIFSNSKVPYISCNFRDLTTGKSVVPGSIIIERNGAKVAFVGISTPVTISSTTPIYFQDEKGNYLYDFYNGDDPQPFYDRVQEEIDSVKDQVDYVVAVGHMGNEKFIENYKSSDLIANTTGLTAFIDGHSHVECEMDTYKDKEGNDVVLTNTGSYLKNIGVMHISDGKVTTKLVNEYDREDEEVLKATHTVVEKVNEKLGEVIAILEKQLYIYNPDDPSERIVRKAQTGSSDFAADAIWWYFNEYMKMDCDIGLINAGGIRADVPAGDFTYFSAKLVEPFGNVICMIEATGAQVRDALETGAVNSPGEGGSLMKAGGLKYTIDTSIPSTLVVDENLDFKDVPTGEYRVKDIEIFNRETGEYEPLDLEKTYTIGGVNYILRNGGGGLTMMMDNEAVVDFVNEDYMVLAEYAKSFAVGEDGKPHINNANSPLAKYSNYLYDYEDPWGSDRLIIK